ncbi:RNA-directed DNA polymerase [Gossypium australe]|uniref:RNA-directed DNA polymerase n=1 Tax=Gossypium australe TaxID=47621 RepID=A0A5B6WNE2_9ROSI|nr:RNA-directed DNA polymerase [Gossypium australe]
MNGAMEAANKNIKKIVGKMADTYKDWHEKLPFALYAYRMSVRTSTGATPFSLVRPRQFHEGDLILKKNLPIQKDFRGKWMPNWEGPYVVKQAFSRGALILTEMDGKNLPNPVNLDLVKKYFP